MKYKHDIGIPKTCGCQNYGEKAGFSVRDIFALSSFSLTVLYNVLQFFFRFYHFTCLTILKEDIVNIKNYDCGKYFSIAALGKSGRSCAAKMKEKYQKNERRVILNCKL